MGGKHGKRQIMLLKNGKTLQNILIHKPHNQHKFSVMWRTVAIATGSFYFKQKAMTVHAFFVCSN